MPVVFRDCASAPLHAIDATAPDGYVIGVIGEDGAGKRALLDLAAGVIEPTAGSVDSDPRVLCLYHALAMKDALTRSRTAMELEQLRRRGGIAFLVSHEPDLIAWMCDEVWWLDQGRLAAKGDPQETLDRYQRHIAQKLRAQSQDSNTALPPAMRRGDGRARLLSIETLDANGTPVAVWQSGETATIRVRIQFTNAVADPVIGILIRTRIGFEVYGTNTQLEHVTIGPCQAGERKEVLFHFPCTLCPNEYTLTAASHDPDGVWHDWVEDGVAFAVADFRYTAGVAALRARVEVRSLPIDGNAG